MSINDGTPAAGVPQVWHPALLRALETPLVYEGLCNRKYEGEIQQKGDTVRIVSTADVATAPYVRGTPISAAMLPLTDQTLVITEANAFRFDIEDIDVKQNITAFADEQSRRATYNLKKDRDTFIAETMRDGVATANQIGTFSSVGTGAGEDDPYELLTDLATSLLEADTPEDFLFVVVPVWFAGELLKDPRRVSFGTNENLRAYGRRYLGTHISGLEVFQSNQVPFDLTETDHHVAIAGWGGEACAFAAQIMKEEEQRIQGRFASMHIGLDLYGATVVRPDNLASMLVKKAA